MKKTFFTFYVFSNNKIHDNFFLQFLAAFWENKKIAK